jgi:hypothetical protein
MRKLLPAVLLFVALPALADMVVKRQWGVATTVGFTMPDYSDPIDLVTNADVTFATGDVKYSCDEGAQANIGSLPTEEGTVQFAQALTAAEMRCARVHLLYIDTATKVWADWGIIIETYGCHTATDFTATIRCGTAVDGDTQEITLDASASSTTDAYVGHPIRIIAGTGAGQGDRTGTAYNGTSKVLTVNAAWHTVPDNTSVFQIDSDKEPIITADANGVVSANVVQLDGDAGAAAVQEAFFDGSTQALTNVTIGTVTTLTGHTAQTGDSYALIGTPKATPTTFRPTRQTTAISTGSLRSCSRRARSFWSGPRTAATRTRWSTQPLVLRLRTTRTSTAHTWCEATVNAASWIRTPRRRTRSSSFARSPACGRRKTTSSTRPTSNRNAQAAVRRGCCDPSAGPYARPLLLPAPDREPRLGHVDHDGHAERAHGHDDLALRYRGRSNHHGRRAVCDQARG